VGKIKNGKKNTETLNGDTKEGSRKVFPRSGKTKLSKRGRVCKKNFVKE